MDTKPWVNLRRLIENLVQQPKDEIKDFTGKKENEEYGLDYDIYYRKSRFSGRSKEET